MEFQEVKELINFMRNHPYVIWCQLKLYADPQWMDVLDKMINCIELSLENDSPKNIDALNKRDLEVLTYGAMLLPAIMLKEEEDKSWEVYTAIVMAIQNYGAIFESDDCVELAANLSILVHGMNTFKALIVQAESAVVMSQSILSNTRTPYNLSGNFLRAILPQKESSDE